jgi:hypothetical protein
MELVKGKFFEVSGINCSIENPSFVTAVISAAQFRFSRPWNHKFNREFAFYIVYFVYDDGDEVSISSEI